MAERQTPLFTTLSSILPDIAVAAVISLGIWLLITMIFESLVQISS